MVDDLISRQAAIDTLNDDFTLHDERDVITVKEYIMRICMRLKNLPSAQPEIAEKLYLCKCYITDKEGLQHEVIHTGDIRRVTGWMI